MDETGRIISIFEIFLNGILRFLTQMRNILNAEDNYYRFFNMRYENSSIDRHISNTFTDIVELSMIRASSRSKVLGLKC